MKKRLTSDWNSCETESRFHVQHILNAIRRGQDDRVCNKAVLVALYRTDHGSLSLSGLIVVNHTDTTQ